MSITAAHTISGIGKDIGWCSRRSGGKYCMLCGRYVEFPEWSSIWHWNYLLSWTAEHGTWYPFKNYAHLDFKFWGRDEVVPGRFKNRGLKEHDLMSLLRKGCKENKNCKCASIAQRASWYCPRCHTILTKLATHYGKDVHDLMMADKNDIKKDALILILSGAL